MLKQYTPFLEKMQAYSYIFYNCIFPRRVIPLRKKLVFSLAGIVCEVIALTAVLISILRFDILNRT